MRSPDADAVARVLESHERRAYVLLVGNATFVYDERSDQQDLDAARALADMLARECRAPVLAAVNHDDDVLWLALADPSGRSDIYNSFPGYFDDGSDVPAIFDVARLCAAFGVPGRARKVEGLLGQRHADIGLEFERHQRLAALIGIDKRAAILGYGYVVRGEARQLEPPAQILCVAGAPDPGVAANRGPAPVRLGSTESPNPMYERSMAAMQAEAPGVFWNSYALALQEGDVPERSQALFGVAHGNGHFLFTRLREYVISHRLVGRDGWIHADDLLADFLGEREFNQLALARLLLAALGLQPFSAEQIASFQRGDPELLGRIARAVDASIRATDPELGTSSGDEPDEGP